MKQIDYVTIIEGQPVRRTFWQRRREAGISCRNEATPAILEALELEPLYLADRPVPASGEIVVQDTAPTLIEGAWVLGWTVRAATAQEVSDQRARMHRQVASQYSQAMAAISTAYPPEEREGWPEQVAAAEAVIGGGTSALIDALRAGTGETAAEMAQTIMTKRAQYMALYGAATGNRRALDAQIAAAAGKAELDAIDVTAGWPA